MKQKSFDFSANNNVEKFITLKQASEILGIPISALQRAAKSGTIPSYKIAKSRRRVRVSELIAAMEKATPPT